MIIYLYFAAIDECLDALVYSWLMMKFTIEFDD